MVNQTEGQPLGEEKIYSAICAVMEDIGAVGKNGINKTQGFKYRGIDAVMNALSPAMIKHKVFCVPELLEQTREERQSAKGNLLIYSICRMRYRFFTTDGSFVDAVTVGEGMDSGDKATNKAMAVAFKYACFQTFCIPTEELMDDPDKESPEAKGRKKPAKATEQEKVTGNSQPPTRQDVIGADQEKLAAIRKELNRTGVEEQKILAAFKVKKFEDMTQQQYAACMRRFKATPDMQAQKEAVNE